MGKCCGHDRGHGRASGQRKPEGSGSSLVVKTDVSDQTGIAGRWDFLTGRRCFAHPLFVLRVSRRHGPVGLDFVVLRKKYRRA